jgi:hypothetical protein
MTPSSLGHTGEFIPEIDNIEVDTILRIHGYKEPSEVRLAIREIAAEMIAVSIPLFEPVVYYRQCHIKSLDGARLVLDNGETSLHNPEFSNALSSCTDVMIFLLTLGNRPDRRSTALQQTDNLLEALFLESASWLAIERATRSFVTEFRQASEASNTRITSRLAPGYGDWPLTDQERIFFLFRGWDLKITLTDGNCMQPKMSRSGLYGIRPS